MPKPTQYYDRDPYPKVERLSIAAGQVGTSQYTNKTEEVSEIKSVQVNAPPNCTVELKREEDNQIQMVAPAITVARLNVDANGNPTLFLREVERDKPLTVRKNQTFYVVISNPNAFAVYADVIMNKNALRFYTPQEVTQEATQGR